MIASSVVVQRGTLCFTKLSYASTGNWLAGISFCFAGSGLYEPRLCPMRKRSKGFALARNTGSPLKISGYIAQPARPRSTASELYVSQPCLTKKFSQPSRPSGVVSYVTPVSPPPCHIRSGTAPRRFAGRKYCTYIASTEYVPFRSTFAGTPPGVNTTSLTGFPEISTSRPPTWNEPMSRRAMGAEVQAVRSAMTTNSGVVRTTCAPVVLDLEFLKVRFFLFDFSNHFLNLGNEALCIQKVIWVSSL